MIVEIAIATQTAPRDWWDESEAVLATALDVMEKNRNEVNRRVGHR